MGQLGAQLGVAERATAINIIGSHLQIPSGGFALGQSKLFERGDIRLYGVLRLLMREAAARSIAANLANAARFGDVNILLTMVTAQREHATSITASGTNMVNSFEEGGLDHLWSARNRLGLPKSVTGRWRPIPPYPNPDAIPRPGQKIRDVYPAEILARDQTLIYAAQINASFQMNFKSHLRTELGVEADSTLARASRIGRMVWQSYAFLAPGGKTFDPKQSLASQADQSFGSLTALQYVLHKSRGAHPSAQVDLELIFRDPALNVSAWVRSAKSRVVETLFLERLLTTVRELVFVDI
jgi:hypothetical protein